MVGGSDQPTDPIARGGVTRRDLVLSAASLGAGVGLDRFVTGIAEERGASDRAGQPSQHGPVPFYGEHQAGVATPAQEYLSFAAFDLTSDVVDDLRGLLEQWTAAAAALTAGRTFEPEAQLGSKPPQDPGETLGLDPAELTITIGLGPSVFSVKGADRFGLAARAPAALRALPPFKGESLDPTRSGGDLCVQACANDPQLTFHAVHLLALVASRVTAVRWTQLGFGRTASTSRSQPTPRALIGFKDGTNNIRAEDTAAMRDYVWVQPGDGPDWMVGGTYLVARRIRILFDVWDATSLEGQERTIGRRKESGAPLSGEREYDPVDLGAKNPNGEPAIPESAHVRLATPRNNGGQRILRRGYSYSEGLEPGTGQLNAGLFFIAFQRDPRRQFIPLQRRLADSDALNRHIVHTASAVFACPPGLTEGGFLADGLLT
jgi:deferrochelatase/peroxidase EfeB